MTTVVKSLQIDRIEFQRTLDKKLTDLPPLPAVVLKVMETVNRPDTSAEDLNRLISLDQSLSSKLLRIVNSAYYGFPRRISTVTHAVVILGFNTVRNLVLGVSAFEMLSRKQGPSGLNRDRFWEHSVATAIAAGVIMSKRRVRTRAFVEEAFLTGLLHDVGQLFLDCYFPMQYAVTLAYADRECVQAIEAERLILGINHAMVAQRIAEVWNFPPTLVGAFGGHHQPVVGSPHFESAAVAHAADWLAWQAYLGSSDKPRGPQLCPAVEEWLAFDEEAMRWARQELKTQFDAASDLVSMARR